MTKVKICGLTNLEDALAAVEAGADLLGFIFAPISPRYVEPERAKDIIEAIKAASASPPSFVGVFVDETLARVREMMAFCGLNYVQLHGQEEPGYVRSLFPYAIKALRVWGRASLEALASYQAVAYLLDTYHPGKHGGSGATFDWELAVAAKAYGPIILAGGLTPHNVADAVRQVRPYAVDVASGVEVRPGKKDHRKVRQFIQEVQEVQLADGTNRCP